MLRKENRLKNKHAFSATYNNNNVVSDNIMIAYAGKEKIDKNCPTRVGFVVSKKVHKRATKRNRIKRLMRENIRLMLKNDGILDAHLDAARALCVEMGVPVCDCYKIWQSMYEGGVNTTELLANKINHPIREMHQLFAYELVKIMLEVN